VVIVGFSLWLLFLYTVGRTGIWLVTRNARIAVIAGGAIWTALCGLLITDSASKGDTVDRIAAGFFAFLLGCVWWLVAVRLRQLRARRMAAH
jgi:hypothetical protein